MTHETTLRTQLNEFGFDWPTGELVVSMNDRGEPCLYGEQVDVVERRHYSFREGVVSPGWVDNLLDMTYGLGMHDENTPLFVLSDKSALYFLNCPEPGVFLRRINKDIQHYLSLNKDFTF